jgi:beta-lactamase regulating signal transducer with metallopeptidase domain
MPFAALVGIVRPRLFLSGRFIESLSAGERRAVVDHEAGHLRALDNLKRLAMRLAPDWLALTPVGTEIEEAWAIAAEEEADDFAAGADPTRACDLAGALLKAVRFPAVSCAGASGFCDHGTIARRVKRLLDDRPLPHRARTPLALQLVSMAILLAATAVLAAPVARAAYATTEAAIRFLQ